MGDSRVAERAVAVDARVVANEPLCREHVRVEVVLPAFPRSEPGQFLQLRLNDSADAPPRLLDWPEQGLPELHGPDWEPRQAFLRRPFSIADQWLDAEGRVRLAVISRRVGSGTRRLEHIRPGDVLNLTGPLGHGFVIPSVGTPIALVGGGVGIPPLLYLARRLNELGHRDVTAIFGATTADLLPVRLLEPPAADGMPRACLALPGQEEYAAVITTNDGSAGLRGQATDGLRAWCERQAANGAAPGLVLACGPEAMLRAVAADTRRRGLACQLCIERSMGCGLGTCLSCIVRAYDDASERGWRWALACMDGPVFWRDELLDYSGPARP